MMGRSLAFHKRSKPRRGQSDTHGSLRAGPQCDWVGGGTCAHRILKISTVRAPL
jgi:hypothetical protein